MWFLCLRLVFNRDGVQTAERKFDDVDALTPPMISAFQRYSIIIYLQLLAQAVSFLYAISTVVKLVPPAVRLLAQLVVFSLK